MKPLEAKNLFAGIVRDYDLKLYVYTVVYKINDTYYDMRLISHPLELSVVGRLGNRLSYKARPTVNDFYGSRRDIIIDSLQPYYKDGRETFTVKELLVDMVNDQEVFTNWPGFSTYPIHQKMEYDQPLTINPIPADESEKPKAKVIQFKASNN